MMAQISSLRICASSPEGVVDLLLHLEIKSESIDTEENTRSPHPYIDVAQGNPTSAVKDPPMSGPAPPPK